MIDDLMPFAQNAYEELGSLLNLQAISQKNIIDFFPTPQMKLAFHQRYAEDPQYLSMPNDALAWKTYFNDDFGFGIISSCLLVNISDLLSACRLHWKNQLQEETFDITMLEFDNEKIQYKDIEARSVIFCDGSAGTCNPYFDKLPFAPNKGEVLWIESKEIPDTNIFKAGINLVPWKDNIFWVGSSYEWEYQNDLPTESFRNKIMANLDRWLKVPFKLVDHQASIRPATLERRPFVGFHPIHKNIGIFNGMGTKGCSLAPYFAKQFVDHIVNGVEIQPDVDISRFRNILSKNN